MSARKGGLGKGLNALIADATAESGSHAGQEELLLDEITPNPNQPRTHFDELALADLADSIKKEGLLQPILVRPIASGYQIIAGERRWQACKLAGLEKAPVRVIAMDDAQTMRVALIENLQRTDLNPIEEAHGFKELMSVGDLTQAELAEAVSKSRSAVANSLRLLDLPKEVQDLIFEGRITAGHARAILAVSRKEQRIKLAKKIADENLSVREAEKLARLYTSGKPERARSVPVPRSFKVVAKELSDRLDAPVRIRAARGKNKIEIEFKNEDDLKRIYDLFNY